MAKRTKIDPTELAPSTNLFAATTPPQAEPIDKRRAKDPVKAISVALREAEYAELDQIAAAVMPFPVKRMAVMNEALRFFLREYAAGRLTLASTVRDARVGVEISQKR